MARSTTAQLRNKEQHITLSEQETDSPILPIAQIERLKEVHPERVDWVFEETSKEGNFRRSEVKRVNTMVFVERILGMIAGLVIGTGALYACYSLAMAGHDAVAGIVGGTTVVGLVSAFVIGVKRRSSTK
ncbi:hypothetical protein [Ramlibacter sp. 2FC]|uniref:hypothetical protein n=1 Tax=Ramlibacter sp. 2FC TaxID=2502188 RepID=UPI0010F43876|nr:hypothetical protein [Ramlibacter sp. 2FC]